MIAQKAGVRTDIAIIFLSCLLVCGRRDLRCPPKFPFPTETRGGQLFVAATRKCLQGMPPKEGQRGMQRSDLGRQ